MSIDLNIGKHCRVLFDDDIRVVAYGLTIASLIINTSGRLVFLKSDAQFSKHLSLQLFYVIVLANCRMK